MTSILTRFLRAMLKIYQIIHSNVYVVGSVVGSLGVLIESEQRQLSRFSDILNAVTFTASTLADGFDDLIRSKMVLHGRKV